MCSLDCIIEWHQPLIYTEQMKRLTANMAILLIYEETKTDKSWIEAIKKESTNIKQRKVW